MLRVSGRAAVIVGLTVFYGCILLASVVSPVETLMKVGAIVATVGCYCSIGALLWPPGDKGNVAGEATLGFFCLPAAIVSAFAASGDEVGLQASWLIITVFFLPGAIGLITQAARVKGGGVD